MAYQIYKFDDVMLPVGNNSQEHSPGQVDSGLRDSIGGVFDAYGSRTVLPRRMTIQMSGLLVGERSYEVDEDDNRIVDEDGNNIVSHGAGVDLRVQVEAVQRKIGVRASLWRRWLDSLTTLQWKTARMVHAPWPQSYDEGAALAEMTCTFETEMAGWRAETQTSDSVGIGSSVPSALLVNNGGSLRVDDAVIQIARGSSDITTVTITNAAAGISLAYSGTIGSGETLEIDCGGLPVTIDDTDAYSGFSLGSGHTARGWLPLEPGNNLFEITADGDGIAYIKHYDQYP